MCIKSVFVVEDERAFTDLADITRGRQATTVLALESTHRYWT